MFGDNGDLSSIFACCVEIRRLTSKIDGIFLNAGTMGKCSLDITAIMWSILKPWQLPYKLATGDGLLKYEQATSKDGIVTLFTKVNTR